LLAGEEDPWGIVRRLTEALPPGSYLVLSHSYLVLSHSTGEFLMPEAVRTFRTSAIPVHLRTHDEIGRLFDGLEVLDPGVVSISNWRAEKEPGPRPDESETATDCAVARIR
jgi:hypothetical protein